MQFKRQFLEFWLSSHSYIMLELCVRQNLLASRAKEDNQVQKQTQNYSLFLHVISKDSWLIPREHFQCVYLVLLKQFLGKDMRDLTFQTRLRHFYVKLQNITQEYLQTVNVSFFSCVWTLNTVLIQQRLHCARGEEEGLGSLVACLCNCMDISEHYNLSL